MTTFADVDMQAATEAASEAENRGRAPKFEALKSSDFTKTPTRKLGRPTRIMPPPSGTPLPWITVKKHELRDPYTKNSRMITSWTCPRHHGGKRCLLCEMEEAVSRQGIDNDLAYMLRPRDRYLSLVLDVENGSPVLRKFEFGVTVQRQLLALITDRKLNFSSLNQGFPIDIMFNPKEKVPAQMWKAERPDDTSPRPISEAMIEEILALYPQGGLNSLLFTPTAAWQYKQFQVAPCSGLQLPWGMLQNLPSLEEGEEAVAVPLRAEPSPGAGRPRASSHRDDIHVNPGDDIPF